MLLTARLVRICGVYGCELQILTRKGWHTDVLADAATGTLLGAALVHNHDEQDIQEWSSMFGPNFAVNRNKRSLYRR